MQGEISITTEVARAPVVRVAALKHFLPAILFTMCFGVYIGNGGFLPGNDQVGNMLFSVNLLKRHSFAISPPVAPQAFFWTIANRSGPPVGGPMSERGRAPEGAQAHQSPEQEIHHVPAPCDGKTYDPRPLVDNARRTIAYLLIALLALLVIALLAMVAFDVITVSDIKEFGTIFGPLVALVSAATGFYYANQGAAFSGTHTKPSRTDPHSET